MSSPFRRTDHARQSPSRQHVNGTRHSHRQSQNGAESAQFLEDLKRLLINDQRELHKQLDERALEQQKLQVKALEDSLAKHNASRKEAEDVLEQYYLDQERARIRRAQEEAEKKEEARRKLEEERRKQEEQKRQIAAQREREEAQRAAEQQKREEAEKALQKAAKEKEETDRKAREQAAAQEAAAKEAEKRRQALAQASQQQQPPPPSSATAQADGVPVASSSTPAQPTAVSASSSGLSDGIVTSADERKKVHSAYLDIHNRLKELRAQADGGGKNPNAWKLRDPNLRNLSEWRHELRTRVNQISRTDKEGNKATIQRVQQTLDRGASLSAAYTADVSGFFYKNPKGPGEPIQGNLVLLFLLNHFVKLFFGIIEREVLPLPPHERSHAADHVGNMAVQVFATPKYWAEGNYTFIDILWAKFHKKLPLLFGVRGGQQDELIIPWASCFASITLRDFRNSRALPKNPAPARLYWEALARILNTPTERQTLIHYQIIQGLLHQTAIPRFIAFYGQIGILTLKHALFEFPKTAPANKGAQREANAIRNLAVVFDNDLHLKL
ncbi:hypothetical protein DOTSEDRAFT_68124 [Lecanosticta acicola]|uniref:mRNA export factor GLE1 n=1 Tax=Lecanosticta acicola TaxID=111012 RepID=A0AAI9E8M5_9PEZI|nr:hypothetical protein DOTSEDRAFT_68124 [Lecanosticta acicola]